MKYFLFSLLLLIGAHQCTQAQSALSSVTNTARLQGVVLTIGAHTNVFQSPARTFYNGEALYVYNRTKTAAWIDTLYFPGPNGSNDSTGVGIDSTHALSFWREGLSWLKPGGGNFLNNYPTITFLPNPIQNGRKTNWLAISFPAADTLTSKLVVKRPFR